MSIDDFVALIQGVGFPIVVAGYLLWDRMTMTARLLSVLSRIESLLSKKDKRETDRLPPRAGATDR